MQINVCVMIHKLCNFIVHVVVEVFIFNTDNWEGGIRLKVGFQPLMVISPTASWTRWCMQGYAVVGVARGCSEYIWTCLVWAERSTPDIRPKNCRA